MARVYLILTLAAAVHNQRIAVRYARRAGNIGMGGDGEHCQQGGSGDRFQCGHGVSVHLVYANEKPRRLRAEDNYRNPAGSPCHVPPENEVKGNEPVAGRGRIQGQSGPVKLENYRLPSAFNPISTSRRTASERLGLLCHCPMAGCTVDA